MELICGVKNTLVLSKKPVIAAVATKFPKFYLANDMKKSFVNKHKLKPTKLRLMISNLLVS